MKVQGFIWAGIYVQDIQASIAFYRDVLGLPLLEQDEDWAHLDAGAGALLELFSGGTSVQGAKTADQQSIVLGLRVDDLDQAVETLRGRGVRFILGGSGEFAGTRWAHFYDPEGNRLEVKEVP